MYKQYRLHYHSIFTITIVSQLIIVIMIAVLSPNLSVYEEGEIKLL